MAYLYARYFQIDGGEHGIEEFRDERYMDEADGTPCVEMDQMNGGVGFWQYAVTGEPVDDPSELSYWQSVIGGRVVTGSDALAEAAVEYFDGIGDDLKDIIYYSVDETSAILDEVEASAGEVFGEDSFRMEVDTGVNHVLPVDEDDLETFDLDRFHIILVMYKCCEIDDAWVRLIPLEDFEPDGRYATVEEAMDAGAVESAHGLNVDALPQEYRDDPDQIGYELCDEFLDDFEQFGYVTALK